MSKVGGLHRPGFLWWVTLDEVLVYLLIRFILMSNFSTGRC